MDCNTNMWSTPSTPCVHNQSMAKLAALEPTPPDLDFIVNLKEDSSIDALYPPASGAAAAAIADLPVAKRSRNGSSNHDDNVV